MFCRDVSGSGDIVCQYFSQLIVMSGAVFKRSDKIGRYDQYSGIGVGILQGLHTGQESLSIIFYRISGKIIIKSIVDDKAEFLFLGKRGAVPGQKPLHGTGEGVVFCTDLCCGGAANGQIVGGGFRQSSDDPGNRSEVVIISEDTVPEENDVVAGQIGIGSRGINGFPDQRVKMIQTAVFFCITVG